MLDIFYNGDFPKKLIPLAEKWAEEDKEFYISPENAFVYNLLELDYSGSEGVSRDLGAWSIHTSNQVIKRSLSKDEIDQIAYYFSKDFTIDFAIVWVGSKCNISCNFCPYHGDTKEQWEKDFGHECVEVEIEVLKKRINKLKEIGVKEVELVLNGEPFMYKSMFDIIEYVHSTGIDVRIIFSNGTMLDEKTVERIANVGVKTLSISLNAFSYEAWSIVSGCENREWFCRAVEAPILAKKYGLKTEVSMVIGIENKHEVEEFLDYWKDKADIVKVNNQVFLDKMVLDENSVDVMSLPYYLCDNLRGRPVVSSSGRIVPCCIMYHLMDEQNSNDLPMIDIDQLSAEEIKEQLHANYREKAYIDICKRCFSKRLNKCGRREAEYYGIKGQATEDFFFVDTSLYVNGDV